MSRDRGRLSAFARRVRGAVCEVCGVADNYRRGVPVPGLALDVAHLVARCELATFGEVGRPFLTDAANCATLCQKCHAAFDVWLGVMGAAAKRKRHATPRFTEYRTQFMPLLHRRHRLVLTLLTLSNSF